MLQNKSSLLLAVSFSHLSNAGVKIEMTSLAQWDASVIPAFGRLRASGEPAWAM